jgi:hypothetical protein
MALLQSAINQGMDVEKMSRLMDLQDRWMASRSLEAFTVALNACQRDLPVVVKDAQNTHTRTRYARLENVVHTIKPTYTKHGFSLSFAEGDSPRPEHSMRIIADLHHVGGHSRQYHLDVPLDGMGAKGNSNMTATQGKGSTFAYGKRYLTCSIFNVVVADEDLDGNNGNTPISDEQEVKLSELLDYCEELGVKAIRAKFFAWLKVETVAQIPASRFDEAVKSLNTTIAQRKAKNEEAA